MKNENYMKINFQLPAVCVLDGLLEANQFDISLEISSTETTELGTSVTKADIAYQKLQFWLTNCLSDLVIVSIEDTTFDEVCEFQNKNIMVLPDYPSEELISKIMHCKMCSIVGDDLSIGEIQLRPREKNNITYCFSCTDCNYDLPGVEYITDGLIIYDAPWWFRNTSDIRDEVVEDSDDEISISELMQPDILHEFESALTEKFNDLIRGADDYDSDEDDSDDGDDGNITNISDI